MKHYVGLDVGVYHTSICVIDDTGARVRETSVQTDPDKISHFVSECGVHIVRVGMEAGGLAEWLYRTLAERGLPIICIEARHAHNILKTQLNKTDKNDARGLAAIVRLGLYRTVHAKTAESRRLLIMLTNRRLLQIKAIDLENAIAGIIRMYGFKTRRISAHLYEAYIRGMLADAEEVLISVEPLLIARRAIRDEYKKLDARLNEAAAADPVCRRLMTVPGVGPIVAARYRSCIDIPERFRRSRTVGAHLGLTVATRQSGTTEHRGRISRFGDVALRTALCQAASTLLVGKRRASPLREWGLNLMARVGRKKAMVALARKIAVLLHRLWIDKTEYQFGATAA